MTQLLEFKNLKELMIKLGDESVCRAYMEQMRWPDGNVICPHCNGRRPYKLKDGRTYRCREKTCKKDFTVTVGTIFENSKVKLSTWLAALYVITGHKKGMSSHQLARFLGITQKTAWFVLHRLRYIMNEHDPEPLTEIVEVDETYIGGKVDNMNRARRKKWQESGKDNKVAVMGLLQRDGRARLTVIGANTLKDVVRRHVHENALVITDSHLGYVGLDAEFAGHATVNHSISQYRDGIAYTNSVEGFFSIFKRTIYGTYHSISPKHLHRYCAESTYRFNSRKIKDRERFSTAITNTTGRLKYKNLIGKTQNIAKNG